MDPLLLSFSAIIVVIVGVLVVRLHPFLALSFGALLVAVLTPATQLYEVALKDEGLRIAAVDGLNLEVKSGQLASGLNLVYRKLPDNKFLQEVGEVEISPGGNDDGLATVQSESFNVEPGDLIVHASRTRIAEQAAKISAGQRFATGFGETCRKIGILIAMAAVIGMCLLESGAARRIVDSTRDLVGEKRTPVAFAISGFVVGIPVFFDTVFYLLMPLAKAMRVKTGGNYLLYVMSIVVGASMAHSLVPPTPGPLLVASELEGVDIGDMMVGGLIVGMIAVASGFLYSLWANRRWEIPLREDQDATDAEQSPPLSETSSPPLCLALLPILLPVVLLAGKTFSDSFGSSAPAWFSSLKPFIDFMGDKNIALVSAAVIALTMLAWQRKGTGAANWFRGVQQALSSGGVIILITAAGGAFGHVLRQCGVAEAIQGRFPSTQDGMVLLFLAFVVTAVVRFAQGSATVAMITGVSIVGPIAADLTLGYHPVYLALAIGCGSKPLPWMNDSGFWIVCRMSGMTEAETLKIYSTGLTIMGVVGFLVTLAGAKWLPLVVASRTRNDERMSDSTRMNTIADREAKLLAAYAMHSIDSKGRKHPEIDHMFRGPFQRDRDRVLHSAAFRRLSGKTQVFTGQGDYHRTRLTHTMEVSSIARTIGRTIRLNEDLIEALTLLHDIGHPPFGHAGEEALDEMLKDDGGFSHNRFALTLVEELEQRYPEYSGLNLTSEVLGGQRRRIDKSESAEVPLLEVQVVDLADSIAYNAHDVDDAVELGWLELDELLKLPILATCHQSVKQRFGDIEGAVLRRALVHELINLQVAHLIYESEQKLERMEGLSSEQVRKAGVRLGIYGPLASEKSGLQKFLYSRLYRHEVLVEARTTAQTKIKAMGQILLDDENKIPETFRSRCRTHGTRIGIVDYIASMTDQSFLETYRQLAG